MYRRDSKAFTRAWDEIRMKNSPLVAARKHAATAREVVGKMYRRVRQLMLRQESLLAAVAKKAPETAGQVSYNSSLPLWQLFWGSGEFRSLLWDLYVICLRPGPYLCAKLPRGVFQPLVRLNLLSV